MSRLFSIVPDHHIKIRANPSFYLYPHTKHETHIIFSIQVHDQEHFYVTQFVEKLKQIDYREPVRLDINCGIVLSTDPVLDIFMGMFYEEKENYHLVLAYSYTRIRQQDTRHISLILQLFKSLDISLTSEGGDWYTIQL